MRIIILQGDHGKGKTTTIKMVYAVLVSNNAAVKNFAVLPYTSDKDFEAELAYQNKNIAIYSKGDIQADCNNAITKYANSNVDVLVLAYSKFKNALNTGPHTSIIINKTVAPTPAGELQANVTDCRNIFTKI